MRAAKDALSKAAKYREYGADYDRNIDAAAQDLESALERGRRLETWLSVLELRLRGKENRGNPKKRKAKSRMASSLNPTNVRRIAKL